MTASNASAARSALPWRCVENVSARAFPLCSANPMLSTYSGSNVPANSGNNRSTTSRTNVGFTACTSLYAALIAMPERPRFDSTSVSTKSTQARTTLGLVSSRVSVSSSVAMRASFCPNSRRNASRAAICHATAHRGHATTYRVVDSARSRCDDAGVTRTARARGWAPVGRNHEPETGRWRACEMP